MDKVIYPLMFKRQSIIFITLLFVFGSLPIFALSPTIMTVRIDETVLVYSSPSADSPIVGSLEPTMVIRITRCNEGCAWLEMGPNVWIANSHVTQLSIEPSNAAQLPTVTVPALALVPQVDVPTTLPAVTTPATAMSTAILASTPSAFPTLPATVMSTEMPTLVPTSIPVLIPTATQATTGIQPTSQPFTCANGCATPPNPLCDIKGNVNSSGERIYHTPASRSYARTDIKPEEGDAWFCTEQEAKDAGFRAAED